MLARAADRMAMLLFDLLAYLKAYRFAEVKTPKETDDFNALNQEAGFLFPPDIETRIKPYKDGGVCLIAYHHRQVAGIVRLADPAVANRPFDLYGVDAEGRYFEIQNLLVAPAYRDGSQFVMIGLFRAMYAYSRQHHITSWISCSTRNVYRTMRRYNKNIQVLEVDFSNTNNPVTRYLYEHNIFDTCYTMQVADFSPWKIFVKHLKYKVQNAQIIPLLKFKISDHESFSYRSK